MIKKLLIAALLLLPLPAKAEQTSVVSGADLLEGCTLGSQFGDGFCLGFITGVSRSELPLVCIPDNTSNGEIKDVVVGFLKSYQDGLHLPARRLIYAALIGTFHCSK